MLGKVSKEFKLEDIDIKLPRNKHDNVQSKAQSYSTLMGTKTVAPEDALSIADMTNDITGVVERGEKYWNEHQENQDVNSSSQNKVETVDGQNDDKTVEDNANKE